MKCQFYAISNVTLPCRSIVSKGLRIPSVLFLRHKHVATIDGVPVGHLLGWSINCDSSSC